ncbi:unnamed protein product [Cercopithifilaria johnstoni]|uniref:Uncharacterized protein n=1 Tax=Cercopithifilaria johnstoni TaxID=2874296 RepID=A0A8J2PRB1_9BILA|nr:unnamed protein product [Cercopithifilaria johnstoni]
MPPQKLSESSCTKTILHGISKEHPIAVLALSLKRDREYLRRARQPRLSIITTLNADFGFSPRTTVLGIPREVGSPTPRVDFFGPRPRGYPGAQSLRCYVRYPLSGCGSWVLSSLCFCRTRRSLHGDT